MMTQIPVGVGVRLEVLQGEAELPNTETKDGFPVGTSRTLGNGQYVVNWVKVKMALLREATWTNSGNIHVSTSHGYVVSLHLLRRAIKHGWVSMILE